MFILLPRGEKYKGILVIAHVEFNFLKKWLPMLSKYYYIYGHSCPGYPSHLSFKQANYFIDDIHNNNFNINKINSCVKDLLNVSSELISDNNKIFDFISIQRCTDYKKVKEILKIMILAANTYNKISCLILVYDGERSIPYHNEVLNIYENLDIITKNKITIISGSKLNIDDIKYNKYCGGGFNSEQLSFILKTSKIFIHGRYEWDECRIISEAALNGCIIFCPDTKFGHMNARNNTNAFVTYNINNLTNKLKEVINKSNEYKFDEKLYEIYSSKHTIPIELEKIYKYHKYDEHLTFENFFNLCDSKTSWSYKIPGHFNEVPWANFEALTHHIITEKQYNKFLNYIKL